VRHDGPERGGSARPIGRRTDAAARAYWKAHPRRGIGDNFFDDAANDSIPAMMARVEAAWWWRSFFTRLQAKSKRHHAADGLVGLGRQQRHLEQHLQQHHQQQLLLLAEFHPTADRVL
jgi:hypothetical protein